MKIPNLEKIIDYCERNISCFDLYNGNSEIGYDDNYTNSYDFDNICIVFKTEEVVT